MLTALAAYLQAQGYTDIFLDFQPEIPENPNTIALYCWEKVAASMHDGTANHLIQLRVRRKGENGYQDAMRVCNELVTLLDSGDTERPIPLPHPGVVIGRVRRLPIVMERQGDTVTVYAELALWGLI